MPSPVGGLGEGIYYVVVDGVLFPLFDDTTVHELIDVGSSALPVAGVERLPAGLCRGESRIRQRPQA